MNRGDFDGDARAPAREVAERGENGDLLEKQSKQQHEQPRGLAQYSTEPLQRIGSGDGLDPIGAWGGYDANHVAKSFAHGLRIPLRPGNMAPSEPGVLFDGMGWHEALVSRNL